MTNAIPAASPRNPAPQRTDRAVNETNESEAQPFTALLTQRWQVDVVGATDATVGPGPLGVGGSLVEASEQSLDAAGVASAILVAGEAAQGVRERGLDAASSASNELASRSPARPALSETAPGQQPSSAQGQKAGDAGANGAPSQDQSQQRAAGSTRSDAAAGTVSDQRALANSQEGTAPRNTAATQTPETAAAASLAGRARFTSISNPQGTTGASAQAVGAPASPSSAISSAPAPQAITQGISVGSNTGINKATSLLRQQPMNSNPAGEEGSATAQVQRGLAQVLRQGGGTLTLRMTPNDLGEVKVELRLSHGRVEGVIEASTPVARDLLRRELDQLASSLERRGVTVDRLDVRLREAAEGGERGQAGSETRHTSTRADTREDPDGGAGREADHGRGGERRTAHSGGAHASTEDAGGDRSTGEQPEHAGHGRPAEPVERWLRLDTFG